MRRDGTVIITSSSRLFSPLRAEVAELADAQASGACGRKVVEVQILSSAPILDRRGPLHPTWLTAFRSHFAARSTPFAYQYRRGRLHPAWLTAFRSHFAARSTPFAYQYRRGRLHPAWLTAFR